MKTNLFKFKRVKKNKIVLEEETVDSPFLLFLKKNKKYIFMILLLLCLISLIIAGFIAIRGLKESSKIVTNINHVVVDFDNGYTVNSVNMKPISGGQAIKKFYDRYGNIGLREGVIFVVKEVTFENGVITYYSDGSSKIVNSNGDITRVSALEDGSYGVMENGNIVVGANTKYISINKSIVLEDGTQIIYYSDNSCEVIIPSKNVTMLVRNSDRLVINNNRLIKILPSGISDKLKEENINGYKITYYEDGTIKLEKGSETYVIRDINDLDLDSLTFPNNNESIILKEISLNDGSKLIYYTDGSCEIIMNNETIMVRESKDVIYTEERIIEITETKYADKTIVKNTKSGEEIIYLNNGGALIKYSDGTYKYVYENSDIKYDIDGNIKNIINCVNETGHKVTPSGTIIINLEDGNSIIIDDNGYRIIETNKIIYDKDGNIKGIEGEIEITDESISNNSFVIENLGSDNVRYKVVIEVSDDYKDYAPVKLNPIYLRYNIVVDTFYLENQSFSKQMAIGTKLQGNVTIEKETYILYEGELKSGSKANVDLGIWLDYDDITNDYKNSVFVGTIKVYSETIS